MSVISHVDRRALGHDVEQNQHGENSAAQDLEHAHHVELLAAHQVHAVDNALELVLELEQVQGVQDRVLQLSRAERALTPVGALVGLVGHHAEALLQEGRQPGPGQPGGVQRQQAAGPGVAAQYLEGAVGAAEGVRVGICLVDDDRLINTG